MKSLSPSRSEQTRLDIIRAAHDLFLKQGYHGTSMRQIARQAGIALGGVYNHFPSKEEVFHAVFLEYHPYHDIFPALKKAQGDSLEEVVRDALGGVMDVLESRPDFFNLMFIELIELNSAHVGELFAKLFPQGVAIAHHIFQKDPEKLRPIPIPMVLRTFMGMFFAYYLIEVVFSPRAPVEFSENARDYLIDIFLHGILAERGAAS